MEFIRRKEPYSGYVVRTTEKGKSYRVAPKWPDDPNDLALCHFTAGSGWVPFRDLTEEEKKEYHAFMSAQG